MKIGDLLRKYGLLSKEIVDINYHMNALHCDVKHLKSIVPELFDKNGEELALCIKEIFDKCDSSNPEYDAKLDEEMTRMGLKTDVFYPGYNHNKWNNGMFEDDGFGFGTEPSSLYDDYIDSMSDEEHRSR